ncbi:S100 calcium binding protein P [Chelydra serpentina]|uniref:S100 calcium binding protein P n=1 Tax=Chelydra serpentina TaxID=8475 RepID=A0A8T1S4M2_CHESE|nr:S100 calcium binding protein P [Chelydra serpentina]
MLTPLEGAVGIIVEVFHKYSSSKPPHDKLSKGELKCLIQKELGNLLLHPNDPDQLQEIFDDLDVNKDHKINFKEYMILATTLIMCVHEKFQNKETHHPHPPM